MFVRLLSLIVILVSLVLAALFALRPADPVPMLSYASAGMDGNWLMLVDRNAGTVFRPRFSEYTYNPTWSPDSRWLAYNRYETRNDSFQLDSTEPGTAHVTYHSRDIILYPHQWSPDSRLLLLYSMGRTSGTAYYTLRVGQSEPQPLDMTNVEAYELWSLDSTRLYYRDPLGAIGYIDAACLTTLPCEHTPIFPDRRVERLAGWLPNGREIMVWVLNENANGHDLFALDPDNGVTRLLFSNPLPGAAPVWSPNGRMLAASLTSPVSDSAPSGAAISSVYLVDGDTGRRTLVWTGVAGTFRWSPDGRTLAFVLVDSVSGSRSVHVYDVETDSVERFGAAGEYATSPQWVTFRGGTFEPLWIMGLDIVLAAFVWRTRTRF